MKIKTFQIRLTNDFWQSDQDFLNEFMDDVIVKKTSTQLIIGQINYWSILVFYEDQKTEKQSDKFAVTSDTELTADEKRIYDTLKQWRLDKARELNIPRFMVCHNTELMTVAKVKPQTLDDLIKIKGFGEHKISKLGDEILAVLNSI